MMKMTGRLNRPILLKIIVLVVCVSGVVSVWGPNKAIGEPKKYDITYKPREQVPPEDPKAYKEFNFDVQFIQHELLPEVKVHALAFNGQVPGPVIRVKEGDWVKINFTNKTELNHTIHWHGIDVPYEMDGVPFVTQDPVMPNKTFVYKFRAHPAGTRFYHCHFGTPLHMSTAMEGAFIIEQENDPVKERFGYDREYVLVYSTFATEFSREEFNRMLERMKQRMILMKAGKLDSRTLGVFNSYEDFLGAIEDGYVPPYSTRRNQMGEVVPNFNYFAINGKCYPATEKLLIREGEKIRVRLINAGGVDHDLHLHGHQFWKVSDDGNDLPEPILMNTISLNSGKTADIIIEGNNPGYWTFHDHMTWQASNNGIYPGGALLVLVYEGFEGSYKPKVSVDQ